MGAVSDFYNSNHKCRSCGKEIFVGEDSIARDRDYNLHECVGYTVASVTSGGTIRKFETGATRNTDTNKLDYAGFISPIVLERYSQYMHKNRVQSDGQLRAPDNWTKGIPIPAYLSSLIRHVMSVWKLSKGFSDPETLEDSLCGVIFNSMGYLYELRKNKLGTEDLHKV